jgi:hypothetical protein
MLMLSAVTLPGGVQARLAASCACKLDALGA